LIAWKEPEYSYFPSIEVDVCQAVRYASLWCTKDPTCAVENKILFLVMVMDLDMVVNQYPRLSSILYKQYCHIAEFKEEFHGAYVKVMKDPTKKWHPLSYLVT